MKIESNRFFTSPSPHIRAEESTRNIMTDVLVALLFPLIMSVYFFGWRTLLIALVSVFSCMFFEWGYDRVTKQKTTVRDLTSTVTGLLIALCLPVSVPVWIPVFGAFFAIVVVKKLYGGLGKNFLNPALTARAFMYSWPALVSVWIKPNLGERAISVFGRVSRAALDPEIIASLTPLGKMKLGYLPSFAGGNTGVISSLRDVAVGNVAGAMGEVSAIVIVAAAIYLLVRRVITIHIPAAYVGTVAILSLLFPLGGNPGYLWAIYSVCSGGLLFGAVFLATDYATSPVTPRGRIYYGIGCGILTFLIRYFGVYEDGVTFAILIMNCVACFMDKLCRPVRFGASKKGGARK
ncbi:MAG: RnfABCDGE type electron transport complex subunit D [Oscillospiraceae bacterium]|nr:RnfABCDGE type electron transport complex subunit D [Oscillospiraceae bacterium]